MPIVCTIITNMFFTMFFKRQTTCLQFFSHAGGAWIIREEVGELREANFTNLIAQNELRMRVFPQCIT